MIRVFLFIKINMKNIGKIALLVGALAVIIQWAFPQYAHAQSISKNILAEDSLLSIQKLSEPVIFDQIDYQEPGRLQLADWRQPKKVMRVTVTAYSSTVDQCDSTPFITANGTHVKDGIVAANFLPFGAQIKLPEVFGDQVFSVEDRMNERYYYRVDVWMPTREQAKQFGVKYLLVEIY